MKQSEKWKHSVVTGGWVSPPHEKIGGTNYITDEQYATVKECGIDYLFTMYENPKVYGYEKLDQALDLAKKHGVACIVGEYRLGDCSDEECEQIVNRYRGHEAFVGFNLFDEPGIARFCGLQHQQERVKAIAPECLCYINLLPMYAFSTILKGTYKEGDSQVASVQEYAEYLDEFVKTYKSEVMSYDFYPFRFAYGVHDKNYFTQMQMVRERAAAAGLPFWTFIQLTAWGGDIPLLTDEEIRWQVHTSLAGNAAGIMYFTYWTPIDSDAEQYRGALMTRDGKRGPSFDTVKQINAFIGRVGELLRSVPYRGLWVPPSLREEIPSPSVRLPEGIRLTQADDILIGVYGDEKQTLLYAVNTSFAGERTVALSFAAKKSLHVFSETQEKKLSATQFTAQLDKGDAVLICLQ